MNDSHPLTLPEAVVRRRELQAALDASRRELQDRDAALAEARKDRASIVAFLTAEADRLAAASRSTRARWRRAPPTLPGAAGDFVKNYDALNRYCDGLMAQSETIRDLAVQIKRGDDRQGGE